MRWYAVHLILECRKTATGESLGTVEEQVRILTATDDEEAYRKALRLGASAEHEYDNSAGERVRWVFAGLGDLDELSVERIEDGTEIASKIIHGAEAGRHVKGKPQLTVFLEKTLAKFRARDLVDVKEE
jgi:hypothetical protein